MRKRRSPGVVRSSSTRKAEATAAANEEVDVESSHPLRPRFPIAPVSGAGGQDCFAVAALHLLAQTDLEQRLGEEGRRRCGDGRRLQRCAACLIREFLAEVRETKGRQESPLCQILHNASFVAYLFSTVPAPLLAPWISPPCPRVTPASVSTNSTAALWTARAS